MEIMSYEKKSKELTLIPKYEFYMEYMLEVILLHLPRTEKFSIGTEYKKSVYQMINYIMYLNKIKNTNKEKTLKLLNKIDAEIMTQRIFARIMKNNRWIDENKFKIIMEQIYEIGKILGGLIKYYAKDIKK